MGDGVRQVEVSPPRIFNFRVIITEIPITHLLQLRFSWHPFPQSFHISSIWTYSQWGHHIDLQKYKTYFGEGDSTPLQYSCLENPMDGGAWFHFHALEKEMATHSSVLAKRFPGMGEPGGLPSMGSHRVEYDWSDLAAAAKHIYFLQKKSHNPTLHFLVVFPSQKTKVELYKYSSPI